jgi:DNA-binding MarR family transcriptional regulator
MPTDLSNHFGFLLKDVSRLCSRNFERLSIGLGLSLQQCRVLSYLQRHEGVSQVRLAYLTDNDPMTLRRLLVRMEADGLVERRLDPHDGRAHRLYLRAKARPVLEEIHRLSELAHDEAFAGFSAADRTALMNLLRRLHTNLDALMPGISETGNGPCEPATGRGTKNTNGKKAASR